MILSNFKFIKKIEVEGLTEFSDHCPINVSFSFYKEVENDDDTFSDKLFWDASKSDYLLEALNTKKACFDEVIRNDLLQAAGVSVCVQNLTGLMYETCYSVFGRSVSSKPKVNSKKRSGLQMNVGGQKVIFCRVNVFLENTQRMEIKPDYLLIKQNFEKLSGKLKEHTCKI